MTLKQLRIVGNPVNADAMHAIARLISHASGRLQDLDLPDCLMGAAELEILATALATDRQLQKLSVNTNKRMGAAGVVALANAIAAHPTLSALRLGDTMSDDDALRGLVALANAMGRNFELCFLLTSWTRSLMTHIFLADDDAEFQLLRHQAYLGSLSPEAEHVSVQSVSQVLDATCRRNYRLHNARLSTKHTLIVFVVAQRRRLRSAQHALPPELCNLVHEAADALLVGAAVTAWWG